MSSVLPFNHFHEHDLIVPAKLIIITFIYQLTSPSKHKGEFIDRVEIQGV